MRTTSLTRKREGRTPKKKTPVLSKSQLDGLLIHTVKTGNDIPRIESLLEQGADPNCWCRNGTALLYYACAMGHLEGVRLLLKAGAAPNVKTTGTAEPNRRTPLHMACYRGHTDLVRLLLDHGADPNVRDKSKVTPLHFGCYNKNPGMIKLLIEAGADVNARDEANYTPFHHACVRGHTSVVLMLLEAGADASTGDNFNSTPLHTACMYGRTDIARLLLERGMDPNTRDKDNCTSLDMVKKLTLDNPAREEIIDLFREFHPEMVMELYCTTPGI